MIALIAMLVWLYLAFAHGRFWSSTPQLPAGMPQELPDIDIIVPARDEAATIGPVIASLTAQDYRGNFRIILVDDNSTDGTGAAAGVHARLTILRLNSKPPGWSGKMWALSQGVAEGSAPIILFTDADILHDPRHLSSLAVHLLESGTDLVSEMVHLHCESWPERALIPAFVYFFQMLYPFSRVNDPRSTVAAAAGGTVLIRRAALLRLGGIETIRGSLIDDVALARAAKRSGTIFLGHSQFAESIRLYPLWSDIWNMIARTAFTQLRYSASLLALTVLGLALVWWAPLGALLLGHGWHRICGGIAFAIATLSFWPTLSRYGRSRWWALTLPLIALFYMAATIASALDHWRGRGAQWKARAYGAN